MPRVTVVIPSYNHHQTVERAIQSVLTQTFRDFEVVVIDDCSKDSTWASIEATAATSPPFSKQRNQKNLGVSATLNKGISETDSEYVTMVASDDWYVSTKLERQIALFETVAPSVGLVHSASYFCDLMGTEVYNSHGTYIPAVGTPFIDLITQRVRVTAPTAMFRRRVWEQVGGFDEKLRAEDVDFYVRVAEAGFGFEYDREPLVYKTATPNSLGAQFGWLIDVHLAILEKHKDRFSNQEYEHVRTQIVEHVARLAAGGGDLALAAKLWAELIATSRSPATLVAGATNIGRAFVLHSLPPRLRKGLRHLRAQLR